MNSRRSVALMVFVLLLIYIIFEPGIWAWDNFWAPHVNWEEEVYQSGKGADIVLIDVYGPILASVDNRGNNLLYHHETFMDKIEHAFTEDYIKGIVLRINSLGGGVAECDEIYQQLLKLKQENEKPLVVFMDQMAVSGAYYIALPADRIYASRNTITGSIGVALSGGYNFHRLADTYGVEDQTFTSGPYKDILNPMREMTQEERDIIQSLVDDSFNFFMEAIIKSRGLSREEAFKYADGRLLTASQAKAGGFIDQIGFLDDALDSAAKLAEIEDPNVIKYTRKISFNLETLLGGNFSGLFRRNGSLPYEFLLESDTPRLLYMWTG